MKKIYFTLFCFFICDFAFTQSVNSMLSNSEILSKIFPKNKIENDKVEWKGNDENGQIQLFQTFVKFKEFYIQDDFLKCLIFTESNYEHHDCHGCGALLGGVVMKKEREGWVIEVLSKEIGWMGAWGKIGIDNVESVRISERNRGVLIRTAFGNQGYYTESVTLLGVLNNDIKVLGNFIMSTTNEGSLECSAQKRCYELTSKINFSIGINHILYFIENKKESDIPFDIIHTTIGTAPASKESNSEIINKNRIMTYHFKNGQYELASTENIIEK